MATSDGPVTVKLKFRGNITHQQLASRSECTFGALAGLYDIPVDKAKFLCRGVRLRSDQELDEAAVAGKLVILIGTPRKQQVG